jgi:hypothetical protein
MQAPATTVATIKRVFKLAALHVFPFMYDHRNEAPRGVLSP